MLCSLCSWYNVVKTGLVSEAIGLQSGLLLVKQAKIAKLQMCVFPAVCSVLPSDRMIYEPMQAVLLSQLIILLCAPIFPSKVGRELVIIGRLQPGSAMARAVPTADDRVCFHRGPCGIKLHWDGIFSGYFGFLQSVLHHCHPKGGQWVRRRSHIHIDDDSLRLFPRVIQEDSYSRRHKLSSCGWCLCVRPLTEIYTATFLCVPPRFLSNGYLVIFPGSKV
jgi:hypothetical protein